MASRKIENVERTETAPADWIDDSDAIDEMDFTATEDARWAAAKRDNAERKRARSSVG